VPSARGISITEKTRITPRHVHASHSWFVVEGHLSSTHALNCAKRRPSVALLCACAWLSSQPKMRVRSAYDINVAIAGGKWGRAGYATGRRRLCPGRAPMRQFADKRGVQRWLNARREREASMTTRVTVDVKPCLPGIVRLAAAHAVAGNAAAVCASVASYSSAARCAPANACCAFFSARCAPPVACRFCCCVRWGGRHG